MQLLQKTPFQYFKKSSVCVNQCFILKQNLNFFQYLRDLAGICSRVFNKELIAKYEEKVEKINSEEIKESKFKKFIKLFGYVESNNI